MEPNLYEKTKARANQGDADSQKNLGVFYSSGFGVPQDFQKAVYWFQQAANQGNAEAQYMLGTLYVLGRGVPQDYEKSIYWVQQAANQGYAEAQEFLEEYTVKEGNADAQNSLGDGAPKIEVKNKIFGMC